MLENQLDGLTLDTERMNIECWKDGYWTVGERVAKRKAKENKDQLDKCKQLFLTVNWPHPFSHVSSRICWFYPGNMAKNNC